MSQSESSQRRVFDAFKRDGHVLWFKHLPKRLTEELEGLKPDETRLLLIDNNPTVWCRMQPSRTTNTPTQGVKIVSGRTYWDKIALGDSIEITMSAELPDLSVKPFDRITTTQQNALLPGDSTARTLFQKYVFADYSGAKSVSGQKKSIKLAEEGEVSENRGQAFTRETLQAKTLDLLREATKQGQRVLFGRDHQYSIPLALALELGLDVDTLGWRGVLAALVRGSYGGPRLTQAGVFCHSLNEWLVGQGKKAYFYSGTKDVMYGVPREDPRAGDDTQYRRTEKVKGQRAKPLGRVGDKGTVGGQTLVGLIQLHELLVAAELERIPIAVWPFDGLSIVDPAYAGKHVMLEVYPSEVRPEDVPQTDWNDARACVLWTQKRDLEGQLVKALSFKPDASAALRAQVLFEGWIAGLSSDDIE